MTSRKFQKQIVAGAILAQLCSGFTSPRPCHPLAQSTTELAAATALPLQETAEGSANEESKVGVLLLNLGGPETGDDVEGRSR